MFVVKFGLLRGTLFRFSAESGVIGLELGLDCVCVLVSMLPVLFHLCFGGRDFSADNSMLDISGEDIELFFLLRTSM